jgi:hypothetical protein
MRRAPPHVLGQEIDAMHMLYNSDSFVVVQFLQPEQAEGARPVVGGFEIVDKSSGKEIYLQGAVAESFQRGVEALVQQGPSEALLDEFIAGFAVLAQQPVVLH